MLEFVNGFRGKTRRGEPKLDTRLTKKMFEKQWQIGEAFAKRRKMDFNYIEPVVEIFAEAARAYKRCKILVSRRHQTSIGCHGFLATYPEEFMFSNDPQETSLKREGHIADLVEEKRSSLGLFETTDTPADRACECPPFVSK